MRTNLAGMLEAVGQFAAAEGIGGEQGVKLRASDENVWKAPLACHPFSRSMAKRASCRNSKPKSYNALSIEFRASMSWSRTLSYISASCSGGSR